MRSQTSCTSYSRWLQNSTVFPRLERDDQVLHFARADRIESGGRLVEQDQIGVVDQGLCQADAPSHAFGVFAQLAFSGLGIEPDDVEQFRNSSIQLFARDLEKPAVEFQRLFAVEKAIEV